MSWPVCLTLPMSVKVWSPSLGITRSSFNKSHAIYQCALKFFKKNCAHVLFNVSQFRIGLWKNYLSNQKRGYFKSNTEDVYRPFAESLRVTVSVEWLVSSFTVFRGMGFSPLCWEVKTLIVSRCACNSNWTWIRARKQIKIERLCNIETDTVFELERIFVVSILVKDCWHSMDGHWDMYWVPKAFYHSSSKWEVSFSSSRAFSAFR